MSGIEILLGIGGSAVLMPLLAGGCLFGSSKAVKYAEEAPQPAAANPAAKLDPSKAKSALEDVQPQTAPGTVTTPATASNDAKTSATLTTSGTSAQAGDAVATHHADGTTDVGGGAEPSTATTHPSGDKGGGKSDGQPPEFNPHKEIEDMASTLHSGETNAVAILEPIGQGGFGTVFRGRWRNLEVAVKTVLFSESSGSSEAAQRAQERAILEAAVCTSVTHPNVVATYHYDLTPVHKDSDKSPDWKLFLIQEFCNASLYDALKQQLLHAKETKAPDMDLILCILIDIARGLIYIHEKNIIHGDLTPGNVLLRKDSSSAIGVVGKITDFGLCTTMDPNSTHVSNISNGTPYYVAPEVVSYKKLTKTSDVYSFGVLMWELYRCMPPWLKTEAGYRQNPRFRRFPSDSPRVYVVLCARCLEKNPKQRPSFKEVLLDLEAMHAAYLKGYNSLVDVTRPLTMATAKPSADASADPGGASASTNSDGGASSVAPGRSAVAAELGSAAPAGEPVVQPPRSQALVKHLADK